MCVLNRCSFANIQHPDVCILTRLSAVDVLLDTGIGEELV